MMFCGSLSLSSKQMLSGSQNPAGLLLHGDQLQNQPSLKESDQSIFKAFQRSVDQGKKQISDLVLSETNAAEKESLNPTLAPKVVFPFTYTPDVIMKNSAILHPEEVEHALEEILGKDFRKTPKEISIEKARAARLEAKRLKKQKKSKMRQRPEESPKSQLKTEKSVQPSAFPHFQGWA